eukprot:TRINITY_DN17582_c0_g1_i1.p1 TRINITY_DN17582_c0_g1~~TRINITY_DN17582_c0_g1_i1.p1  ORF type:complete len:440 (+),score=38.46 TRINITY_DN17582_c0_g1_i1:120-1439(+)
MAAFISLAGQPCRSAALHEPYSQPTFGDATRISQAHRAAQQRAYLPGSNLLNRSERLACGLIAGAAAGVYAKSRSRHTRDESGAARFSRGGEEVLQDPGPQSFQKPHQQKGSMRPNGSAFRHPPRAERMPKKLPFSGDEKYWDFTVYPKALFPWSPEGGGRPWDAVTNNHKSRLLIVATGHLLCLAAPFTFSWDAFYVFLLLSVVTGFSVACSYHRQLSHHSFECPKWLEYMMAYFACLSLEGGPIGWVRLHRYHHVHSDKEGDAHSPMDGFWYGHMAWMFDASTPEKLNSVNNTKDLEKQAFYRFMENAWNYFFAAHFLPAAALFALGGVPYLVWGYFLRIVVVWHVNWAVNSAGHVWGYQSYKSRDNSMNNPILGIFAFGDGWHNNHHAFPRSCRHGLEWYEVDVIWYFLEALKAVGLAWNLQYPSEKQKKALALKL